MAIKAIETEYKGYRFRSRLEARWAVYFDALGNLEWEYEPEGFDLGAGLWYLPDFWFPLKNHFHEGAGYWVEIKPGGEPSDIEKTKAKLLAEKSGHNTILLCGNPWPGEVEVWKFNRDGRVTLDKNSDCLSGEFGFLYIAYPCGASLVSRVDASDYINSDWRAASMKARSARFEHGETP